MRQRHKETKRLRYKLPGKYERERVMPFGALEVVALIIVKMYLEKIIK